MRYWIFILFIFSLSGCMVEQTTQETTAAGESGYDTTEESNVEAITIGDDPSAESLADALIIDVRSQKEWDEGHVSQAIHIPHTEIADKIGEVTTDKDARIVLYCRVGGRAGQAKETLEELGYSNVENAGGLDDVKQRMEAEE